MPEDQSEDVGGIASVIRKVFFNFEFHRTPADDSLQLRSLVRAIRQSPLLRQAWMAKVASGKDIANAEDTSLESVLMLILDCPTRWSSTHAMLGGYTILFYPRVLTVSFIERALHFQKELDTFCFEQPNLREYLMSSFDWAQIKVVATILLPFRNATKFMSQAKVPTLGMTYVHFFVLLKSLDHARAELQPSMADLDHGLKAAQEKLTEYLNICNRSPIYAWAARE
jgi:hypothetical protein